MVADIDVNGWAVLAAAVSTMVLGGLWYGPLFGKAWMKGMGWDPNAMMKDPAMKKEGRKAMGFMVLTSLLMAYVLAHFVDYTASVTWTDGLQTGFWIWLGFQATYIVQTVLFEKRSKNVALISAGYQLAALMIQGAILAAWA